MSNSVFQSVIVQLKDISDRTFGVIDTEGCVVSCTDVSLLGERWPDAALRIGGSEGVVAKTAKAPAAATAASISLNTPSSAPVTMRWPEPSAPWPTFH